MISHFNNTKLKQLKNCLICNNHFSIFKRYLNTNSYGLSCNNCDAKHIFSPNDWIDSNGLRKYLTLQQVSFNIDYHKKHIYVIIAIWHRDIFIQHYPDGKPKEEFVIYLPHTYIDRFQTYNKSITFINRLIKTSSLLK